MNTEAKPKITVFHCINSFSESTEALTAGSEIAEMSFVKMACSSMVKDIYLLRAFEAGSDAVLVLVCPEGACRYVEGNIRANKRVNWVKALLDEIGLDARRLSLLNLSPKDTAAFEGAVKESAQVVAELGPNPSAA